MLRERIGSAFQERIVVAESRADRIVAEAARPEPETIARGRGDRPEGAAERAGADEPDAEPRPGDILDRHVLWTTTDVVAVLGRDGRPWIDAWSLPESRAGIRGALDAALAGRPCRVLARLDADEPSWRDVAVTPIAGAKGRPEPGLAVSRGIADLERNEARQTLHMRELA